MNTNIGIIAQKVRSGHSYVNKQFADALKDDNEVYIYAAHGGDRNSPTFWQGYNVKHSEKNYFRLGEETDKIKDWIDKRDIDVVLFNEMYDWDLVDAVNEKAKTVCYLVADSILEGTVDNFDKYDKLVVAAEHVKEKFPDAEFIDWGVDLDRLKPQDNDMMFQHNAGWGGVGYRKCTPQIIKAYNRLREKGYDFEMQINAQGNIFDRRSGKIIERWDKLQVQVGNLRYENQYSFGKVYVGPSEYEGLGLYLPEALASGLPVITTNAEPMNQFIEDEKTGKLVEPAIVGEHPKRDIIFPRYQVQSHRIKDAMEWFLENEDKIDEMSENARKYAEEKHSLEQFNTKVKEIFKDL